MTKLLLGAAAALLLAAPALAADLPRPTAATPASAPEAVYNWTGFYVGGQLGGAFAGSDNIAGSDGRLMAGVQGGADFNFARNWVIGVEAQYSWLPSNSSASLLYPGGSLLTEDTSGLGSVTGRLGYSWGPALLYGKGGYAFRDSSLSASAAGVAQPITTSGNKRDGYTIGGGLEYLFAPNWSAKVEYQYYNFGNTTVTSGPAELVGTNIRNDEHTVKAGINYRFGWGGPPVTRY